MRYETNVVVNRPIEEVWAYMMDPFNIPLWITSWRGLRPASAGPIGLGSTFQGRHAILGSRFETSMSGAVTEWERPHLAALSIVAAGWWSHHYRLTLKTTVDGTEVVRAGEVELRPGLRLLLWMLGPYVRHRWDATAQSLERLLEASRG